MKFIANENIPLASVKVLRDSGYEVFAISEESPGISDVEVLKKACSNRLIVITFDRDYGELIFKNKHLPPAGIVYLRFMPDYPEQAAEILLKIIENGILLEDKFTIIDSNKLRQRNL